MNQFEDLRAFVTVVEAGSFTAAADRLDTAKSAVSRRVSALEERLGAELIRRTTRRLNLTNSGQGFYERCKRILADLDEAESAVAQEHGELRGQLRLAIPLSFGVRHMHQVIAEFSRLHPGVDFDIDLNDRRIDLVEEGMDVAIRIGRLADSSLIARKLFDARTVVCASPQFLEEHGVPEKPDDLARLPCLVYGNLADPGLWVCHDAEGKRHAVKVNVAMSSSSGDFLSRSAANGLGLVTQPTFIAGDQLRHGDLVPVLEDYDWPVTPAWAVYPPTRHLSYRVRAFIDFLVDQFSGVPEWDEAFRSD